MLFSLLISAAFPLRAQTISVQEFNKARQAAKKAEYEKFKSSWFAFLGNRVTVKPKDINPSWARAATEDFLIESGGLKARLAFASRNNQFGFTLSRPVEEKSRVAGFHRTTRSIFMDINQMTANEWLIVFIHEVAHSLDSELVDSLEVYSDVKFSNDLEQLGIKGTSLNELSPADRKKLDSWLLAGLNRGFLAEYRAWLLTYLVYQEGLQDGIFSPVAWLEVLKQNKPVDLKNSDYILRYLSPSWKDPVSGLFAYDFIREALTELRLKIDQNPDSVKLGQIGRIISNEY